MFVKSGSVAAHLALAACVAVLALALPGAALAAIGTAPQLMGSVADSQNLSGATQVAVSGNYAYATAYQSGELTAVNIASPSSLSIAGESSPFGDTNLIGGSNVAIAPDPTTGTPDAFVVSKNRNASPSSNDDGNGNSLTILSLANPASPTIIGQPIRDTGRLFGAYGVAVSGNYAYVAYQGTLQGQPSAPDTSTGGFTVVDISNPGAPKIVANIDNGSLPAPYTGDNALYHATSVAISGSYAYVTAFYGHAITVVNIADPTAPQIVDVFHNTNITDPVDVQVQGTDLYVAQQVTGSPQLAILDISNPAAPRLAGTPLENDSVLAGAYRIRVRGDFAYESASSASAIAAIDISNPAAPRLAGYYLNAGVLYKTTGLDIADGGQYIVASSPYTQSQASSASAYPPYPFQTGGPTETGTISMIELEPNPIAVTITPSSEPSNPTSSTSAAFTFSASDSVYAVQCGLDSAPLGPCTSATSQSYSNLTPGSHTFTVQVTDSMGNVTSASYTWTITGPPSAPSNTTPPSISPTATAGQTLTANPGVWSGNPAPTYTYQWNSCDATGANCTAIQGASSNTYQVQPSDEGSTLSVTVTASNSQGTAQSSSQTTSPVTGPPVESAPPSITGAASAAVGTALSASPGSWSGYPAPTYSYQWQDCPPAGGSCTAIAGATSQSYTPAESDAGQTLEVVITATNSAGVSSATAGPTSTVTGPPANTAQPKLTGSAVQGQTLTATTGSWQGYPVPTFTYAWQRCNSSGASCTTISGASGSTYVLQRADMAKTVRVQVTASNGIGSSQTASSTPSAVVAGPPVLVSAPKISGTAVQGSTLTTTSGTWTGYPAPTYTYQWMRCNTSGEACVTISGATATTYTVQAADVGHALRVYVHAINSAGNVLARSNYTAVVQAGATTNAVLSGSARGALQLRVSAIAARGTQGVRSLSFALPAGVAFTHQTLQAHVVRVLDSRGHTLLARVSVHGGQLVVRLKRPARSVEVLVSSRGLAVAHAVLHRSGRQPPLRLKVTVALVPPRIPQVHAAVAVRIR